jgi:hypothetical protein
MLFAKPNPIATSFTLSWVSTALVAPDPISEGIAVDEGRLCEAGTTGVRNGHEAVCRTAVDVKLAI